VSGEGSGDKRTPAGDAPETQQPSSNLTAALIAMAEMACTAEAAEPADASGAHPTDTAVETEAATDFRVRPQPAESVGRRPEGDLRDSPFPAETHLNRFSTAPGGGAGHRATWFASARRKKNTRSRM
jgi:hypothetical protein